MRCALALLPVLSSCLINSSHAAEPASEKVTEKFQQLQEEYRLQLEQYQELINKAAQNNAQDDDYESIYRKSSPDNTMAENFLELESQSRGTIVGLSCLRHLLFPPDDAAPESPARICELKATDLLCEHYAGDPNFDMIVTWWGYSGPRVSDAKQKLFECGLKSPHKHVRASTLFRLANDNAENCFTAQYFQTLKSLITEADADSSTGKRVAKHEPIYREVDINAARARALEYIDVILKDYADIPLAPFPERTPALLELERQPKQADQATYAERAGRIQHQITHLAIGQKAPGIDRPDAFGKPLRLHDHRGKVTVLMFSFKGCGPCERMYPDNRKLIEEMKGRPFAFLSVMGDADIETTRETVESGKVTWPVWWNGTEDRISERWNVQGWPDIYVIDHTGTIRFTELRHEMLARAVRKRVAEAEAVNGK